MISSNDISVVIPTSGKRERSIQKSVESVLSQTEPVFEILIVWDGVGEPFEFLYALSPKVRILLTPMPFSGVSVARQIGIAAAQKDLICILDDDDVWIETKIADQLELVSDHSSKDDIFTFGRSTLVYENGNVKCTVPSQKFKDKDHLIDYFFRRISIINSRKTCSSSTFMFSKKLAIDHPFKSDLEADEDTDFLFRINGNCKVFYTHKVIAITTYRDSDGQGLSNTKRNVINWLKWVESLEQYSDKQIVNNIKIVYGVRHYLKQKQTIEALKLLFHTLVRKPDLTSAASGLLLFLNKIVGK